MTRCGVPACAILPGAMRANAILVLQIYIFQSEKHRFSEKCFTKISTARRMLFSKRPPFACQKTAFYTPKGHLLQAKRRPFKNLLAISRLHGRHNVRPKAHLTTGLAPCTRPPAATLQSGHRRCMQCHTSITPAPPMYTVCLQKCKPGCDRPCFLTLFNISARSALQYFKYICSTKAKQTRLSGKPAPRLPTPYSAFVTH